MHTLQVAFIIHRASVPRTPVDTEIHGFSNRRIWGHCILSTTGGLRMPVLDKTAPHNQLLVSWRKQEVFMLYRVLCLIKRQKKKVLCLFLKSFLCFTYIRPHTFHLDFHLTHWVLCRLQKTTEWKNSFYLLQNSFNVFHLI